jgi:hypothetical protein
MSWKKLKTMTIDGAPSMTEKKSGLMCGTRRKMGKKFTFTWNLTASSTKSCFVQELSNLNNLWKLWSQM